MLPLRKLEGLVRRHAELENLLCDPAVLADPKRINTLNRERAFENFGTLRGSPAVSG